MLHSTVRILHKFFHIPESGNNIMGQTSLGLDDIMLPILKLLKDGCEHNYDDMMDHLTVHFGLSKRRHTIAWNALHEKVVSAKTYMLQAGLVQKKSRVFHISGLGLEVLKQPPEKIDHGFLRRFKARVFPNIPVRTVSPKDSRYDKIDHLNDLIFRTRDIIMSQQNGAYMKDIRRTLGISQEEMSDVAKRVIRIDSISKSEIQHKGMILDVLFTHSDNTQKTIKTTFPDRFEILEALKSYKIRNPEFLELALKAYQIRSHLRSHKLSIQELLRTNENVNIYDHQILAALKVKAELGGTAMLADEVGLGKTIEAGIIIKEFLTTGLAEKILILTPPSILSQWQGELGSKFDLDFAIRQDDGTDHDLLIMSHASAVSSKHERFLMGTYWDLVIVDEAHSMKNSTTLKHQLVKKIPRRNLLLLTATPLQNNMKELYNLVELLRPGHLGTWSEFKNKYMIGSDGRTFNSASKGELQKTLSEVIIRTRRQEVKRYIPFKDRIPHTQILDPTENESRLYNSITGIVQDLYLESQSPFELMIYQRLASSSTASSKRALYNMKMNNTIDEKEYRRLMQIADDIPVDSKMAELSELIRGDDSKFLVFTEFYATQDYVVDRLKEEGYVVTAFNGKMSLDEKNESIGRFRAGSQIMVSTSAGGEGQNFQFCHNVINYDLPWNPMKVEQRIGRVHRIGQDHDVRIFNYAIRDTIEAYILELLYTKIRLFQMALGDMDLLFGDLPDGGSATWFKEYMDAKNKKEIKNRFSALGNDWVKRKTDISKAVLKFNNDVFANFDLSVLSEDNDESSG